MEMISIIEKYTDLCIKRDELKRNNKEYEELEGAINDLHKQFIEKVSYLDKDELQETINFLVSKREEVGLQIKDLNKKREEAVLDAKEMRIKEEFNREVPQSNLFDTYYLKIMDAEAKRKYYQRFIDNIDFYSNKKIEFEDNSVSNQRS